MSQAIDAASVQALHYFRELSEAEARLAADKFEPLQIAAGEIIFRQGDIGSWLYLLVKGEVEITVHVPGTGREPGEERALTAMYAPAILGEMSLLLDEPRTATATARTECEVWQISREQFRQATESGDQWANRFLLVLSKILAARVSEMNRQLVGLIADKKENKPELPHVKIDELQELRDRLFTQWSF
jgi:CRP-like cAMP-binding protein